MPAARSSLNGGSAQQPVEVRVERLVDVEQRVAAPALQHVELPRHPGQHGTEQPMVDLCRDVEVADVERPPPCGELVAPLAGAVDGLGGEVRQPARTVAAAGGCRRRAPAAGAPASPSMSSPGSAQLVGARSSWLRSSRCPPCRRATRVGRSSSAATQHAASWPMPTGCEHGSSLEAALDPFRAARMEAAARRRPGRVRHLALEGDRAACRDPSWTRHGGHQRPGVGMGGPLPHRLGAAPARRSARGTSRRRCR